MAKPPIIDRTAAPGAKTSGLSVLDAVERAKSARRPADGDAARAVKTAA